MTAWRNRWTYRQFRLSKRSSYRMACNKWLHLTFLRSKILMLILLDHNIVQAIKWATFLIRKSRTKFVSQDYQRSSPSIKTQHCRRSAPSPTWWTRLLTDMTTDPLGQAAKAVSPFRLSKTTKIYACRHSARWRRTSGRSWRKFSSWRHRMQWCGRWG